ncbi:DUF1467 family protein [Sphingomicrobium astaxanthinifaciens]|uniref:DUF1467 family protein n=1 Tax=Sphingomicrobium astaxanthinifaciens TaxID=1227949 RepID=UPI001FCB1B5F|nr:DUF1467 family protein [Sphingomicrobium astaxanthinifaciens]MCJ7422166.1 DUF1467 family protein [Sphingomicrobium astaxanthinifaciens]
MQVGSVLAIYFLFFVGIAFLTLPFGVRTDEEVGAEMVPGQAESAPHRFSLWRHLWRAAAIAVPVTALYVANYVYGWVGVEWLDFYH